MQINMLKSKIHRATVVQSELDYVGSITVDEDLMDASGIYEYEKVQIADVNNGNRFETYVIAGERGSGMICLFNVKERGDSYKRKARVHGKNSTCCQRGNKLSFLFLYLVSDPAFPFHNSIHFF